MSGPVVNSGSEIGVGGTTQMALLSDRTSATVSRPLSDLHNKQSSPVERLPTLNNGDELVDHIVT